MSQLGFTFYPKDWWTSDTFYALNPFERYIYLELLFMMYVNDGRVANDRVNVERRLGITIKDEVWTRIVERLVIENGSLTHVSVNKRLRKALSNRQNGQKGGRPKNPKNPKEKPINNPSLEIESEIESKVESKRENKRLEARAKAFYLRVAAFQNDYPKDMLRKFYDYWTEPNKPGTKMRFELERTWDLKRRLGTWASRDKNFGSNGKTGLAALPKQVI